MKRFPILLLISALLLAGGCSTQVLLQPSSSPRPVVLGDLNVHLENFAQNPFNTDDSSVLLMGMWQNYNTDLTLNELHSDLPPDLNKKVKSRLNAVYSTVKYDLAKAHLDLLPVNTLQGVVHYDDYGYPSGASLKKIASRSGHDALRLTVYLSVNHLNTQTLIPGEYQITYQPDAVISLSLVDPEGKTIWSAFTNESSSQLMQIQDQVNGEVNMLTIEEGPHLAGLVNQGLSTMLKQLPKTA